MKRRNSSPNVVASQCGVEWSSTWAPVSLVTTGLRWVSNAPVLAEYPKNPEAWPTELSNSLDLFIDLHLWFLPLPRFATTTSRKTREPEVVLSALSEALARHQLPPHNLQPTEESVACASACFQALYPHIDVLRDERLPLENAAFLLALLAFDPVEARAHLSSEACIKKGFPRAAQEALMTEGMSKASFQGRSGWHPAAWMLREAHRKIESLKYAKKLALLPVAGGDWIKLSTAKEFFDPFSGTRVHEIIANHARISGFSEAALEENAYIKDLADEDVEVGFQMVSGPDE